MKIGQAGRAATLEPSAIRFYESVGVLPPPNRTPSGYRDYSDADVDLMQFVRRLKALELPLDDIRAIVSLRVAGEAPCRPVRDAIAREAKSVDDRIDQLVRLRSELRSMQQRMDATEDQWPESCVCHVIEESNQGASWGSHCSTSTDARTGRRSKPTWRPSVQTASRST